MQVIDVLKSRRAVRSYLPDTVSREVLLELLDAASTAPSHMNLQPWTFAITDDPGTVAEIGRLATSHLRKHLSIGSFFFGSRQEIESPGFNAMHGAPALIVISATQPGRLSDMACAMAAQSLMLAATSMGLGSCWVSYVQPWLATAEGRRVLGLSDDQRPVAPIVIGGPRGEPASPGRFKPQAHWIHPLGTAPRKAAAP